jgi:hypothetical protein
MAFSSGHTHHELLLIEVGPSAAPVPPGRVREQAGAGGLVPDDYGRFRQQAVAVSVVTIQVRVDRVSNRCAPARAVECR